MTYMKLKYLTSINFPAVGCTMSLNVNEAIGINLTLLETILYVFSNYHRSLNLTYDMI